MCTSLRQGFTRGACSARPLRASAAVGRRPDSMSESPSGTGRVIRVSNLKPEAHPDPPPLGHPGPPSQSGPPGWGAGLIPSETLVVGHGSTSWRDSESLRSEWMTRIMTRMSPRSGSGCLDLDAGLAHHTGPGPVRGDQRLPQVRVVGMPDRSPSEGGRNATIVAYPYKKWLIHRQYLDYLFERQ